MPGVDPGWGAAGQAARVLSVEDDQTSQMVAKLALENAGFEVWSADSAEEALELLEHRGLPHLALIDIKLPGMTGIELAHKIHEFIDLPIIMLTTVAGKETVVEALNKVAEDYIIKPFDTDVMIARVQRVLRRIGDFSYTLEPQTKVDERLSVEFSRRRVIVDGREIELTPIENKLLYILIRNAGRTLVSDYLLKRVWPMDEAYEDTLRTHIYRLRKKIEVSSRRPRYVVTERGIGYSFPKLK